MIELNTVLALLLLTGGLIVLWKSADLLVTGAVSLAKKLGVSPLVVGLTVVAMGTSAPEVSASIAAALTGFSDIAIGNVYGSNIANLALVGGICAIIRPLQVSRKILSREIVVMLGAALLLWPVVLDGKLIRLEGLGLLTVFISLLILMVHSAKKQAAVNKARMPLIEPGTKDLKFSLCVLFIAIGLVGLALGAKMTVDGAVFIGLKVGLGQAVIAQTIVAVGTSLPELITCVVAALKKQDDISIGNLVGSNIFNALLVPGVVSTISPFSITPRLAGSDYWIMVAVSVGFVLIAMLGKKSISRSGGFILLAGYAGYILYLLANPA